MQVTVYNGDARWMADGSTPTSSSGERVKEERQLTIWGSEDILNFRIIAISGIVEVNIIYYKGAT
jgi:hypothetical protein